MRLSGTLLLLLAATLTTSAYTYAQEPARRQEPATRAETLQREREDKAKDLAPPASRCRAFMTHGEREKNVVAAGVCGGSMLPIFSGQNGNPG